MSVTERRQPWLWGAIVAVALLLLVGILVTVVMVSARLRRAERTMVIPPVPVEAPTSAPLSPAPAPTRAPVAATPPGSPSPRDARAVGNTGRPVQVVERPVAVVQKPAPVKVIEKQVQVIEKQVQVIEKQVRVVEKPVRVVEKPVGVPVPTTQRADRGLAERSFRETGRPNQLTYDGRTWNASEVVQGLSADLLTADSEKVDGRTVYHDHNASAPYPHVYLRVEGETDQYVLYVPTAARGRKIAG